MAKTTEAPKSGVYRIEIRTCTCSHDYQDAVYGKGKRVMNPIGKDAKGTSDGTHKCTVCGKKHRSK
jgi:hypothetical protein